MIECYVFSKWSNDPADDPAVPQRETTENLVAPTVPLRAKAGGVLIELPINMGHQVVEQVETVSGWVAADDGVGYTVRPPKYPAMRIRRLRYLAAATAEMIALDGLGKYLVAAVVATGGDQLPPAFAAREIDAPITTGVWGQLRAGVLLPGLTPAENNKQIATVMDTWRTNNPTGSMGDWMLVFWRFTH